MYKFDEILGLFHLTDCAKITEEDIKRAKAICLKMHPDKSRLSPEYFLFYKKAFDILVEFYNNEHKMEAIIPDNPMVYDAHGRGIDSGLNKATNKEIQNNVNRMDPKRFTTVFNDLFEKNMLNKERDHRDKERSKWFSSEEDDMVVAPEIGGTIHDKVEHIRATNTQAYLTRYNGVQTLHSGIGGDAIGNLYDDLDETNNDVYVTSDPFSKLRFDDLRRVHKDQTVFVVSDRTTPIQSVGVETLSRMRSSQDLTPLEKHKAQQMLSDQERQYRELMMRKEYQAKLQTMQNEEKAKLVRAQFLRLT